MGADENVGALRTLKKAFVSARKDENSQRQDLLTALLSRNAETEAGS
jgi:hypothetical protein